MESENQNVTPEQWQNVRYWLGYHDGLIGLYYPATAEQANGGYDNGHKEGLKDGKASTRGNRSVAAYH